MAACGSSTGGDSTFNFSDVGNLKGFVGGVASDEPQATLIGRSILAQGGSAADAATAMYFALAVTYPGAASLGGGGACVTYDRATNNGYALDFAPKRAAQPGAVAVPGNVRGMMALQARYGRLHWGQVLAPAESLATIGHPLSRATARELAALGPELLRDPGLAAILGGQAGAALTEGERVRFVQLGAVIGKLRTSDGSDMYGGELANRLVRDAAAVGGTLTIDDLRAAVPVWSDARTFKYDNVNMMLPPHFRAADVMQRLWDQGVRGPGLLDSRGSFDRVRLALAVGQAGTGSAVPSDSTAASGFAAIDAFGGAAACVVTMLRPFGMRRLAGDTGILLAPDPAAEPEDLAAIVPVVGANFNTKQVLVAATGTGGAPAAAALTEVLASAMAEDKPLDAAAAAPRFFRAGPSTPLQYEPKLDAALMGALGHQGVPLEPAPASLGRVNAIYCSDGMPRKPDSCRYIVDPRGFGYADGGRQ